MSHLHEPGAELQPWDQERPEDPDREYECIACGCVDRVGCPEGCFWTYTYPEGHPLERFGLCSRCAGIPLDDLIIKIRIRQETIIFAGAEAARRAHG